MLLSCPSDASHVIAIIWLCFHEIFISFDMLHVLQCNIRQTQCSALNHSSCIKTDMENLNFVSFLRSGTLKSHWTPPTHQHHHTSYF